MRSRTLLPQASWLCHLRRMVIAGGISTVRTPVARNASTCGPRQRTPTTTPSRSAGSSGATSTRRTEQPWRGERNLVMARHEFVLKLNREITPDDVEALYKAGCSDAGAETGALGTFLDFSREASSLVEALVSAVRDIEKVPGL